jgi:GNAT superfamily N-acetyltransferase
VSELVICTERARQDVDAIHAYLTRSYWAAGVTRERVAKSLEQSLCFGLFDGARQIGFARVVTDATTFAYLADVYVLEEYRGQGLGKRLIGAVRAHPELGDVRRFVLWTRDATALRGSASGRDQPGLMGIVHPWILTAGSGRLASRANVGGARRRSVALERSTPMSHSPELYRLKVGLAEMLKGGVILDVTNADQARIAEEAGAAAVMALERVPADIRREGGVARMAAVEVIEAVRAAVSIPVMAKCRIGHTLEARLLEALGVDFIDERGADAPIGSTTSTRPRSVRRSCAARATSARRSAGSARSPG